MVGVTLSITKIQEFNEFSSVFSWKQFVFEIPTSRETREVKEKNSNVSMSSTILLAISITIQKRRNFFQENWVWNHLAKILMWRETTSLSLGWTCLANLCWTTGILREFSWGGGPSLCGLGLGLGAILYYWCAVTEWRSLTSSGLLLTSCPDWGGCWSCPGLHRTETPLTPGRTASSALLCSAHGALRNHQPSLAVGEYEVLGAMTWLFYQKLNLRWEYLYR